MSIELTCDGGKMLKVLEKLAGKRGKCPDCGGAKLYADGRIEP